MMKLNPEIPIKMLIPIENTLALTRAFITFPRYAVTIAIIPRPNPIEHPFTVKRSVEPNMTILVFELTP